METRVWMRWRPILAHLRLRFAWILMPIFGFGFYLSRGPMTLRSVLGFAVIHLFLYGGANAFNSYYDRDTGPIGGLFHPPPVTRGVLTAAVILKIVGGLLAFIVGRAFAMIYWAFVGLSVAYSHPRIRLKRRPYIGALAVAFGQGGLGFFSGWVLGRPLVAVRSLEGVLGLATTVLFTVALYPLTQSYQVDDDRARGDRTLPVVLGVPRAFRLSQITLFLAGICGGVLFALHESVPEGCALVLYTAVLAGSVQRAAQRWASWSLRRKYTWVMRFGEFNALVMMLYLTVKYARMQVVGS